MTEAGREILSVADVLEAWLARAPQGPIALGSEPAKGPIRSLIGGWGSTMLRALAARPLSLTELDGLIGGLSYPSIERRLSAMHAARQVEPLEGQGGGEGGPTPQPTGYARRLPHWRRPAGASASTWRRMRSPPPR
jgi:hypothetical protein